MCGNNINNRRGCNESCSSLACKSNNSQIKELISIHGCNGLNTTEAVVFSPDNLNTSTPATEAELVTMIKFLCKCKSTDLTRT